MFSEDIGVTMRYPNLRDAQEMDKAGTDSDRVFKLIAKCIESIFTKESVYDRTEHSDQEFEEFIEGLSPEFFCKTHGLLYHDSKHEQHSRIYLS